MIRNGAKDAIGRYAKLKEQLDQDMFRRNWQIVDTATAEPDDEHHNFVDLFSGAGGISLGVTQAGFTKLLSIEIDRDASETIRRNFPDSTHIEGRIEDVSEQQILEAVGNRTVHLVIGGPPCQGFSVAGFRRRDDPRNILFREFVRTVRLLEPWFVVLENVPGILTMGNGLVERAVRDAFEEAGYPDMSVRILESATFGVPQLRARAIFVANRFGVPNPYPTEILKREAYRSIESAILDLEGLPPDPAINHEWTRHSRQMEERLARVPPGGSLYESFRDAWKRQHLGVPSMTIKENHGGVHIHPRLNRVLSAREMARLQTFPDDFLFAGTMKRAMWQIGNALPPLLAKHVALALRPSLRRIAGIRKDRRHSVSAG